MARTLDDEPSLYPPDIEHLTPELREQRKRAIIGTFLLAFGSGLMIEQLFGKDYDYFFLSLGLALLAGWLRAPQYGFFLGGAVAVGFGLDDLVESMLHMRFESTLGALFIAAGFAAVYVRYPARSKWALVPAAFMTIYAVADFGIGMIGVIPGSVGLLPLALISGGAILVARQRLPRRAVAIGLAAAATVFVCSAASSVGDIDDRIGTVGYHEHVFSQKISDNFLTIRTRSGDIEVRTAKTRNARVKARVPHDWPAPGKSTIDALPPNADVEVVVPPGTDLNIETSSGDVDIAYALAEGDEVDDIRLRMQSVSGDISVDGEDEQEDGGTHERDPERPASTIVVETTSGDIELEFV